MSLLPTLTLGNLNIHHPAADPLRVFKEDEIATSSPYFTGCNKHIPVGVSLNGERLIVVYIVIVDYLQSLVRGSLIVIRPEGTKSNR